MGRYKFWFSIFPRRFFNGCISYQIENNNKLRICFANIHFSDLVIYSRVTNCFKWNQTLSVRRGYQLPSYFIVLIKLLE